MNVEVYQLKGMLPSTSQVTVEVNQSLIERKDTIIQNDAYTQKLKEAKQGNEEKQRHLTMRLKTLVEALKTSLSLAVSITNNIKAFQHHVLPSFKPIIGFEINKPPNENFSEGSTNDISEGKALFDEV